MSADTPFLDPEVRELVREVLSDPRAQLLSAASRTDIRGRTELIEPVRPSEIGLTAAERHLVRAYREEVAWLLRQAAKTAISADPRMRPLTYLTLRQRVEPIREKDWMARARRIGASELRSSLDDTASDIFTSVLRAFGSVPPRKLAETSMRLAPSDQARTCVAYDYIKRGQHAEAESALDDILRGNPSATYESAAHENRGMSLSSQGRFVEAAVAYRKAAMGDEARPGPLMSWFVASARSGDTDSARAASAIIQKSIPEDHPSVQQMLERTRLSVDAPRRESLRAIMDSSGSVCRRLIDEILS